MAETELSWIQQAADAVIGHAHRSGVKPIVCASGVSPSGPIHLGNLREVMTAHVVAEEIRSRGHDVVHLHSWDDYDRFRKVPAGLDEGLAARSGGRWPPYRTRMASLTPTLRISSGSSLARWRDWGSGCARSANPGSTRAVPTTLRSGWRWTGGPRCSTSWRGSRPRAGRTGRSPSGAPGITRSSRTASPAAGTSRLLPVMTAWSWRIGAGAATPGDDAGRWRADLGQAGVEGGLADAVGSRGRGFRAGDPGDSAGCAGAGDAALAVRAPCAVPDVHDRPVPAGGAAAV